jgi:hypothetical protein
MQISRAERSQLALLSKDVFGSSSRWQKLVDDGYEELLTEEIEETVPSEKEGEEPTKRKVQIPVLSPTGAKQYVRKYHTIESVLEFMVEQKKQLDVLRAKLMQQRAELMKKIEEENAAKKKKEEEEKLAKHIQSTLSGSAK